MADLSRRVEIIFDAKDNVSNALDTIQNSTSRVTSVLGGAADALLKVETAAVALGAAYLALAVNESAKFEQAQSSLRKALDDSDPSVESFTNRINELSVRFGQAGDIVLEGIATFRNAGFSAKESADLIENALNLQIAGDIPLEETFANIITILKGFRLEVDQLPRAIEAINNVTQASGTSIAQLADGLSTVGTQARLAGLSLEETTAFLAPIVEIFQSGSEAGQAFSIALNRLSQDSKPVTDALNSLEISQRDVNDQLRPAGDILRDVALRFNDLDDAQKLAFTGQLFGAEQAKRLVVAFEDVEQITRLTNVALAETGSVQREVEERLKTFNAQIRSTVQEFNILNRTIGDQLRPAFTGIADASGDVLGAFRRIIEDGGLDQFFAAIRPQLASFEQSLRQLAANLPEAFGRINFDELLSSFDGLTAEIGRVFENLFGDIDVSTPEGLARTLQAVVDTIRGLVNVTTGIIDSFQGVFSTIGQLNQEGSGLSADVQKNIGQLLGAAKLVNDLGLRLGVVALILKDNEQAIDNIISLLSGGLGVAVNVLQVGFDAFSKALGDIVLTLAQVADFLPGIDLTDQIRDIELFVEAIGANGRRNADELAQALNRVGQGLGLVGEEATDAASGVQQVARPVKDVGEASQKAAEFIGLTADEVDKLGEGAIVAGGKIIDLVRPTEDAARGTKDLADNAKALGSTLEDSAQQADDAATILGKVGDFSNQTAEELAGFNQVGLRTSGTFSVISNGAAEASDQLEQTADAAAKTALELEKIASNERIRNLELRVELDITKIEADTQRLDSIIGGLSETFASTGDVISEAFGPLASLAEAGTSGFTAGFILLEETLAEQNRIRAQITDAQTEALKVQTDLQRERLRRARAGESTITINAPPNIETALLVIFEEILRFTQLTATEEGLETIQAALPAP